MNKLIYDCIIIGSGPAALTAAIYMKRAGYLITVLTGNKVGGGLTAINNIENYPGFDTITGIDLSEKLINQCTNMQIELNYFTEVSHFYRIGYSSEHNIKPGDMLYKVYAVFLNKDNNDYNNADFYAKSIIIATGTKSNILGLPNEEKYLEHGIHLCATCDGTFYKNKDVLVIGGGNSAFDAALYLAQLCKKVTIVHRRTEYRAEQALIDKCKQKVNINYLVPATVDSFIGNDKRLTGVILNYKNNKLKCNVDGIFYALGTKQIKINYDDFGDDSRIFSTGDCILSQEYHQIIIAAGDGAKTAIDCIKSLNNYDL